MLWEAKDMQKILNLLKNTQIMICATVILLLTVALCILFSVSPKNNFNIVQNELTQLSDSIRTYYKAKPDYWGLNNETIIKNNIVSKELVKNKKIVSNIGCEFIVGQNENGDMVMPSQRHFMITLSNLSKNACKKLATFVWKEENHLALQKIILRDGTNTTEFEWGNINSLPIKTEIANKLCSNKNSISWIFE